MGGDADDDVRRRRRLSRAAAVRASARPLDDAGVDGDGSVVVGREERDGRGGIARDDADAPRGARGEGTTFVRELPGASGGLEEATLAVMRGVSLGEVCARTGVETMVRTRADGTATVDEEARARTTEAALDAALASAREGLDDAMGSTYAERISAVRSSGRGDVAAARAVASAAQWRCGRCPNCGYEACRKQIRE